MRRDTIFYQLFAQSPALLFDIIPNPPAVTKAKSLIQQLQQLPDSRAIIEMISTIMVYKFTNLTRAEVEAMIGITPILHG